MTKALLPHQQRVIAEKINLDDLLDNLKEFLGNPASAFSTLDRAEQERLERQLAAMTMYSEVLDERIAAF